jgi:hypothetical protein
MNKGYLTEEWKNFRFKIFKRDNFTCIKCGAKRDLQCHHRYYVTGWKLWEYPDSAMETLCQICHEEFHKTKKGGQMFIKKKSAFRFNEDEKTKEEYQKILNHLDILRLKFEIRKLQDLSGVKKKNIPKIKKRLNNYIKILEYNESLKK